MTPNRPPTAFGHDDVRPATTSDLPAIRALQTCLDEPATDLFDGLPPGVTLVSTEGDVPVGYVHAFTGETAYVAELVVAPANRRTGRARRLFETLLAELRQRGSSVVTLVVAAENEAAQALYDDLGFERTEFLSDYYDDGDAYRYGRSLRSGLAE